VWLGFILGIVYFHAQNCRRRVLLPVILPFTLLLAMSPATACIVDPDSPAAAFTCGQAGLSSAAPIVEPSSLELPSASPVVARLHAARPDKGRNPLTLPPSMRGNADVTGSIKETSKAEQPEQISKIIRSRGQMTLHEAVASALLTHPEIRAAEARIREAKSGVDIASSGLYPQGETRLALGGSLGGNSTGRSIYERANPDGHARVDGSVSLRQLLFDFGATRADIERNSYVKDAEKLRLFDKIDEIALKTAQAYLRIMESRALVVLVDETIAAHRKLASIVQANQREGNGTAADVNRVMSRLTDISAIRSDLSLQLQGAEEQFHRLTKLMPGQLTQAPSLAGRLPRQMDEAVGVMKRNNPRLGAMTATARSIEREMDFQRLSQLPKFQLEADGDTKNYAALNRNRNEGEAKAMLTMRYKFMDGGLGRSTIEQLHQRREASLYMMQNEDEQTSADIRQAYRAIDSSRRKGRLVAEGVATSRKVQELYLEQFKAGRRTVFELLDSQMSSFTSRRSYIESRFEGERATFEVLRNIGQLAEALIGTAGGPPPKAGATRLVQNDENATGSLPKKDKPQQITGAKLAKQDEKKVVVLPAKAAPPVMATAPAAPQPMAMAAVPAQQRIYQAPNRPGFLAVLGLDRR
jgi:outer membrane protein, adhesin transport system